VVPEFRVGLQWEYTAVDPESANVVLRAESDC
jgi:hypothetical protein